MPRHQIFCELADGHHLIGRQHSLLLNRVDFLIDAVAAGPVKLGGVDMNDQRLAADFFRRHAGQK